MKTKLTNSQNEQLIRLNLRLAEIEHGIRQQVESMRPAFDSDLASPHSWLEDYEFESVIEFRIREDDPGCLASTILSGLTTIKMAG
ncbi:MAG: hypothetical protein L3J57_14205 [Desulfuromusa sp.]|nr:hypothetical protein [Desulfuromusa sp.]